MRRACFWGVGVMMVLAGVAAGQDFSLFVAGGGGGVATTEGAATEGGGTQAAGPLVDNPQYASWAKHRVGSLVTTKVHTQLRMQGGMASTTDMQMMIRLVEVTPEAATVEMQIGLPQVGGVAVAPIKTEIPAKVPQEMVGAGAGMMGVLPGLGGGKKEGKVDLEVLGEVIKTKWQEMDVSQQGMEGHVKTWMSDEVPGQVVKMEMTIHGDTLDQTMTQTLVGIVEGAGTSPAGAGAATRGK